MKTFTQGMTNLTNKMMRTRLARIARDCQEERLLHAAVHGDEFDIAEAIFSSSKPTHVLHEALLHHPQRDAVVYMVFNSAPERVASHNVLCLVCAAVNAALNPCSSLLDEVRSIVAIIRHRTRDERRQAKKAA